MKNLFLVLFFIKTSLAVSQAGSFDTTFDGDGKNTHCFALGISGSTLDGGFQASGKTIHLLFDYANPLTLLRWNTEGSLDTTFGINGIKIHSNTPPFINGGYYPYRMITQPDDKIIVMGLQQNNTYPNAYWVARLLPDGSLDTSFNGTGYKDLSFGTPQDRGTCVALQTDGKILLGGTSGNTAEYFTVARLNSNGSLDTGFGINGNAQIPFNGNESFVQSMAVQTDGKILLGGYSVNIPHGKDFALVRLNSNGSTDTGFGSSGKVVTTISNNSDRITDLVIEPDGKIIAGGFSSSESSPRICMVRYLANGTIDTTFNITGIMINQINYSRNCSVARQTDGKYVVCGGFDAAVFEIYRYNNNGTLDTSFGVNGFVEGFQGEFASKVLIQPDNKIVVCGSTTSATNQACAAVVRLNAGTLGVEEFANNKITIYPNPSSGIVHFKTNNLIDEKFSVLLYNTLGQKVYEKKDLVEDGSINLSSLAKGIYFVTFSNDTKTITKTLLIK